MTWDKKMGDRGIPRAGGKEKKRAEHWESWCGLSLVTKEGHE